MSKIKHDFGLIFWVHLLLIFIFLACPFLIGWQWVFLIGVLFIVQDKLFNNCILTQAQLGHKKEIRQDELSFYAYYFQKMGLKINPKWVKKYIAWGIIIFVLLFSLFWQIDLKQTPLWLNNIF